MTSRNGSSSIRIIVEKSMVSSSTLPTPAFNEEAV